jgi:hypothetical protein
MPNFVDFISVFAIKPGDEYAVSDTAYTGFRELVRLSDALPGLRLRHLGPGGHGYQLAYNLMCVANKSKESWLWPSLPRHAWSWTARRGVVHH